MFPFKKVSSNTVFPSCFLSSDCEIFDILFSSSILSCVWIFNVTGETIEFGTDNASAKTNVMIFPVWDDIVSNQIVGRQFESRTDTDSDDTPFIFSVLVT